MKQPKAVVLFDIDSTLLNSAKIHALTAVHLLRKFKKVFGKLVKGDWKGAWKLTLPDRQGLEYLLLGRPRDFITSQAVKDSFLASKYYQDALFEDVLPTLKKLRGKVSLGVFSQGPVRLQHAKLYLSGIEKYFEREIIFVFPPRKVAKARQILAQLPETKIYFVDDRLDIAKALANHRVKVFLIQRDPSPVSRNGRVTVIRSLKEITNFI